MAQLRPDGLEGGIVGWDGQVEDDAPARGGRGPHGRACGAGSITHVDAISLGDSQRHLRDEDGGFTMRQEHIIVHRLDPGTQSDIRWAGQGTHLVVVEPGQPTACRYWPVPGEFGRFVFAIPEPEASPASA